MPVIRISEEAHEAALVSAAEESVKQRRIVSIAEHVSELILKTWSCNDGKPTAKTKRGPSKARK